MELVRRTDGGGSEASVLKIGAAPCRLGRAPDNDLVLDDPAVSAQHATVWIEAGSAWIRDANSRNGTFVNDCRVKIAQLSDGDRVVIGSLELVVRGVLEASSVPSAFLSWFVEDIDAGVRFPIRTGRFVIGENTSADLQIEGLDADEEVAVAIDEEGGAWVSGLDAERALSIDEAFEVGGRRFRVVSGLPSCKETWDVAPAMTAYRLEVQMTGFLGPRAAVVEVASGKRYEINAVQRAVLLYVLAKARLEPDGMAEEGGWCSDADVSKAIWGRKGVVDANALHVLVHRVRRELKGAGFDPWFIEKRRRGIRLALTDVSVE